MRLIKSDILNNDYFATIIEGIGAVRRLAPR